MGSDYDRHVPDCHAKTWSVTHKWSDCVLFGAFHTIIDDEKRAKRTGKGKGIGGADRLVYTEGRDAFVAKNRFGLEPEIWMDGGPSAAWVTLWDAITRKGKTNAV